MKTKILGLLAVGLLSVASWAQAAITYTVNRPVGAGTVTGFFETDGTIGLLSASNFLNWSLTIQAPNLNGGVATTASPASGPLYANSSGLSATATDILFDFDGTGNFFTYTSTVDFWCVAGSDGGGCFDQNAEVIGYSDAVFGSAQFTSYRGVQSIAASSVPEPGTLALLGLGLAGLGLSRRRKAN